MTAQSFGGGKKKSMVDFIMRTPRIELGSTAWKATMLTITPRTLVINKLTIIYQFLRSIKDIFNAVVKINKVCCLVCLNNKQ